MTVLCPHDHRAVPVDGTDGPGLPVGDAGGGVVAPGHHPVAGADTGPVHASSHDGVADLARRHPGRPYRLVQLGGVGVGGHRHRQRPLPARLPGRLGRYRRHRFFPAGVDEDRPPVHERLGRAGRVSPLSQGFADLGPARIGDGHRQAVGTRLQG